MIAGEQTSDTTVLHLRIDGGSPMIFSIDHFQKSTKLVDKLVIYEAHESHKNISDHIPLVMKLKIDFEQLKTYKIDFKLSAGKYKCDYSKISYYES